MTITFPIVVSVNVLYTCVFFDEVTFSWKSDGCATTLSGNQVQCQCNHLTSFAVLADTSGARGESKSAISDNHRRGLSIVTYIGVSLSIVCLALVLALNALASGSDGMPLQKRACQHLVLAYLIAMILFLVAIEYGQKGDDDDTCAAIGGFLHYFLLCAFCWMAVEGHILHEMFVVVFQLTSKVADTERLRKYMVFGYGAPAAIVIGVASAFPREYGNHGSGICWLSPGQEGAIWAFVIPTVAVSVANCTVLVQILRHLSSTSGPKKAEKRFKVMIATTFASIMGVTWILAILMLSTDGHTLTVVSYLFTILNGFSGVWIFLFHGGTDGSIWQKAINQLRKLPAASRSSSRKNTVSRGGRQVTNMNTQHTRSPWSGGITTNGNEDSQTTSTQSDQTLRKASAYSTCEALRGPAWARRQDPVSANSSKGGAPWARGKRPSEISVATKQSTLSKDAVLIPWARHNRRGTDFSQTDADRWNSLNQSQSSASDSAITPAIETECRDTIIEVQPSAGAEVPTCHPHSPRLLPEVHNKESGLIEIDDTDECSRQSSPSKPRASTTSSVSEVAVPPTNPPEDDGLPPSKLRRHSSVRDLLPTWPKWNRQELKADPMGAFSNFIKASRVRLVDFFKVMDRDHTGRIKEEQIKTALKELRIPLGGASLDDLVKQIPRSQDGMITFAKLKQGLDKFRQSEREERKKRDSWINHPHRHYSIETGHRIPRSRDDDAGSETSEADIDHRSAMGASTDQVYVTATPSPQHLPQHVVETRAGSPIVQLRSPKPTMNLDYRSSIV